MKSPKVVIFDLDGTLIHSAPDIHASVNVMLASLDREPLELAVVISFIGNGVEDLVKRALKETGAYNDALQETALAALLEYYNQNMTTLTHLYPGVITYLDALKHAGVRMGICTNKITDPAKEICDEFDLSKYFEVIIGAEEGKLKKPDPTPLLDCISRFGVEKEDVLYIGDSAVDYYTARNAKVEFRLFSGGYLNEPLPDLIDAHRFEDWRKYKV